MTAPLGAGGMGEVYRARDTRLGREVAIKVLPEHLTQSSDLRARFEREAHTISSLNHPNICVLHDVGSENGTDFLVMELVDGETLADRLQRGPMPLSDVLRFGVQISDALERAHRAGVIHRDLKPGNVMITKSGAKLMDFGLARTEGGMAGTPSNLSQSPTMTRPLTVEGHIVGTFQYMAPEQLEGRETDARSDVWALGCVLYEMATGKPAFEGPSQASLIGAIMRSEPRALTEIAPMSPPALDQLIRQCLTKDPDDRIQTAHDVKLRLQSMSESGSHASVIAPAVPARQSQSRLGWMVAGVAGVVIGALALWIATHRPEPPRVVRFDIEAPPGVQNLSWARLSPDGRMVAFLASDSAGIASIWVRSLDDLESRRLSGTESPNRMFWSPDSRQLAFINTGKLRKVAVAGGPVTPVADVQNGYDGAWGSDWIIYDGGNGDSIRGVPAGGGSVRPITSFSGKRTGSPTHAWPRFLPDGKHFLFVYSNDAVGVTGEVTLGGIGSFKTRTVAKTTGRVEFMPGWLLFPQENTLMAQRFDVGSEKTNGDPIPVAERLQIGSYNGDFSVSLNGTLAYVSQSSSSMGRILMVDRTGKTISEVAPPGLYRDLALSPDGRRLAISIADPQRNTEDLWVRDLVRGTSSRLTFEPGYESNPVWSPDGERIAYTSNRDGLFRPYIRSANGMGAEQPVGHTGQDPIVPSDWSRDGQRLILRRFGTNNWDILSTDVLGTHEPSVFLSTNFNEQFGRLSPDGRWMVYQSNESGRLEVYLAPADGGAGRWQVSTGGGRTPVWRADGREIFYVDLEGKITAVSFAAAGSVEIGDPVALFRMPLIESTYVGQRFVATADGQRFYVSTPAASAQRPRITVVTNLASELGRK